MARRWYHWALAGALAVTGSIGFVDEAHASDRRLEAHKEVHVGLSTKERRLIVKAYRAQDCILHRESRGKYTLRPNSAGASGAYQMMPVPWRATAQREGWDHLVDLLPYQATRKQQDAVYLAAWKHGNGKFYWSARWGATYACFPGDVKPIGGDW